MEYVSNYLAIVKVKLMDAKDCSTQMNHKCSLRPYASSDPSYIYRSH